MAVVSTTIPIPTKQTNRAARQTSSHNKILLNNHLTRCCSFFLLAVGFGQKFYISCARGRAKKNMGGRCSHTPQVVVGGVERRLSLRQGRLWWTVDTHHFAIKSCWLWLGYIVVVIAGQCIQQDEMDATVSQIFLLLVEKWWFICIFVILEV